ncbi:MAG: hypothetical protein B6D77_14440 [gamma proteobacterium symbiont of Ctena orbiculata]|nr:MAG: hypothetical protein B6D77_14440 [gamma proteobacterium symbiont of Ctena orbiculata]PVV21742.1 MAG: hypothetical protein B6D78_06905 [gamma proteobacterium symbiont of Ctena orbiculata]PVV25485.1 MAG: hypothetical protein B6D79_09135 [gamma proteobacterium symbiont of Ctena orbiculata]
MGLTVTLLPLLLLFLAGCQSNIPEQQVVSITPGSGNGKEIEVAERHHAQPVSVNYPETGVDVGWGWDSDEGIPQPNVCIEYSIEEDQGQTKYMTMSEISDSRELMQSMNVSAAASVKTIAYRASGSAKFAKNTKINSFSSNFVLNVSVDNGVRYATPLMPGSRGEIKDPETRKTLPDAGSIRLTSEALRLAKKRDLTSFLNYCGDSYVAALYGGARLTALITVKTNSKKERQDASASFSGSGWGVNVKASASGTNVGSIESKNVSMRFYQSGGRKDEIPATKGDLLGKLKTITTEASDYPAYYRVTLMPYTALANWPEKSIPLDLSELDQLADYWAGYVKLYEDLEHIFAQPEKFQVLNAQGKFIPLGGNGDSIKKLQQLQDQVQTELGRLQEDALQCSMPEQDCSFSEELYQSPYAYRIQMPLPMDITAANKQCPCADTEPKGELAKNAAILVDYYIRNPVKRRCLNNPVDPGCLSNGEMDRWQMRVGRQIIELPDADSASQLRKLITKDDGNEYGWLDVIEHPPYAWMDRSRIEQDIKPLDTLMALLNQ